MDPLKNEWPDSAEEPGSSPPTKTAPQQGATLSPWWAGPGSPAGVSHVRESGWMSCVCLAVRVTGCVRVRVRTHAEMAVEKKKPSATPEEEKQN